MYDESVIFHEDTLPTTARGTVCGLNDLRLDTTTVNCSLWANIFVLTGAFFFRQGPLLDNCSVAD